MKHLLAFIMQYKIRRCAKIQIYVNILKKDASEFTPVIFSIALVN